MKTKTYITETKQTQLVDAYSQLMNKNNYVNTEKLSAVFIMWLKYYEIAASNYDVYLENELNIFSCLSRVDKIHFQRVGDSVGKTDSKFKRLAKYILSIIPIIYAVLPGGKTRWIDSFLYLLTVQKTRRLKFKLNEELLGEFHQLGKSILSDDEYTDFVRALPRALFSAQIKASFLPRTIKCSPTCFFNEEHARVLFANKPISIIGIQHGGNYGELKENHFERYEELLADRFYHWGLGRNNIKQNRYKVMPLRDGVIDALAKINTVEPNPFIQRLIPINREIVNGQSVDTTGLLYNAFKGIPIYVITHPKYRLSNDYLYLNTNIKERLLANYRYEEKQRTLFIIDRPGHTFFYQAIYQSLPFLMFYSREWSEYYSDKYKELISILIEKQILYYWDQSDQFILRIKNIVNAKIYPKENYKILRNYLDT
jgi:hypothetical protein